MVAERRTKVQKANRISTTKYMSLVMAAVSAREISELDEETLGSRKMLSRLLERIASEWQNAKKTGSRDYASDLLRLYDELSPSVGTGQFDMFATYLRSLQPGSLGASNPYYSEFMAAPKTSRELRATESQKKLASDSAAIIASQITG